MKRHGPINVIIYYPRAEENKLELATRVAQIHADTVTMRIKNLRCPAKQKLQLLDAVIITAKQAQNELKANGSNHNDNVSMLQNK